MSDAQQTDSALIDWLEQNCHVEPEEYRDGSRSEGGTLWHSYKFECPLNDLHPLRDAINAARGIATPPTNTLSEQLARETARANAHMTVNVELHERLTELSAENLSWQARSNQLEQQLEAHAWEISPAMAQAKIDELNQQLTTALARILQLEKQNHGLIQ